MVMQFEQLKFVRFENGSIRMKIVEGIQRIIRISVHESLKVI